MKRKSIYILSPYMILIKKVDECPLREKVFNYFQLVYVDSGMNLIENRLRYSDMRIGEIAFELGFTDEIHLNRFFNKNKHMNPSQYRKDEKVIELA